MIITKAWLSDWIDLKNITTEDICSTLNAIGLEVDSVQKIRIPKNIVVAKVLTCKKHPDADKLNVCTVDLGDEVKQIVCGAKNVAEGQFVAVSKVGAILPNGMEIKEAKLRGLDSSGMICSAQELGLPKMNDGIMVLDDSIGTLILGKELSEYALINDDIIEIELTANRGDCLSVYGVARDLSVPFDIDLKQFSSQDDDNQLGIGRVLNVSATDKIDASLLYRVYEKETINSCFLIDLRLAMADTLKSNALEKIVEYATYTTGVLLRTYAHSSFLTKNDKATVRVIKQPNGLDVICDANNDIVSYVGISQITQSKPKEEDAKVILEANYTHPEIISTCSANKKLDEDRHLYRSSRGSEPDLNFGMDYVIEILKKYSKIILYAGSQQVIQDNEETRIPVDLVTLNNIIGSEIPKNRIIHILQRLGFEVIFKAEQSAMNVKVPQHRHDILNIQDICEEIVRIVGIDNIPSKPLIFAEKNKINDSYNEFQKRKMYRHKAVGIGFFETLHFIFDDLTRVERYGLKTIYKKRELSNPITNELNTLRTSLIPNLLESVSRNSKFGRKSIRLFEVGTVFNKSRTEKVKIAFIFSGESENETVSNHGKPAPIDFFKFAQKVSNIVGDFELENATSKDNLSSPYEYAKVIQRGIEIGFISRVHLEIEKDLDLARTYICQLDMQSLAYERKEASDYSSFPVSVRDLSLMIPRNMKYLEIKKYLLSISPKELIKFYPIDVYEDDSFGDKMSLTIKLQFQSIEKNFIDEDIVSMTNTILESLQNEFGITIR